LIKAMNLVTSRPAHGAALVAPANSGRALIVLPWQGRTVVGTSESARERKPDDQQVHRAEVSAFIDEVNHTFPGFNLDVAEITLVHRGIVPAQARGGRLTLLGHSKVIDHAADGISGLISLVGVKYTTARAVAERAVDLVLQKLGRSAIPCRTAESVLPTAGVDTTSGHSTIQEAVVSEMAQTLADVVVRRTGLGAAGYPGDASVNQCAEVMGELCGWPSDRRASEIETVKRFYEIES
jgi:glycerol-3-phosphate dehydrogenase